ncbi:uncharacterized protein LOC111249804 [Varroa destructor]|uniref:Ig-like domain-containing protein n=1 Tax=Varroa destructor TaxID=109461 RepID=A0A7M7M9J2_VARDE|nr:uncharacterized protein LOC111249804 [Varroa destructor]
MSTREDRHVSALIRRRCCWSTSSHSAVVPTRLDIVATQPAPLSSLRKWRPGGVDPFIIALWVLLLSFASSAALSTLTGANGMPILLPLVDNSEILGVNKEDKQPLTSSGLSGGSSQDVVGVVAVVAEEECPTGCFCKWANGKRTAECGAAGLTEVPEGLNRDTQVLNLSNNTISFLGPREFHAKGYSNLQRIHVARCGLSMIAPSAFHLLTNLVELDLSSNKLHRVPSSALSDCGSLRRLSLSFNPIETIHDDAFRGLSRLGTLELNFCRLTVVESLAFRGLRSLEFLRMAHNLLKRVPPNALIEHLPPQLYGVNLEENPWTCDCEMRQVRQWMEENNIPLSAPPKCAHPHRLQGVSWQALELADFACAPELAAIDSVAAAVEAENATLRCEVEAQPPSSTAISWAFNGRPIRNMSLISFGRQLYIIREEVSLSRVKTSVLTIVNAFVKDSGSYTCVATNRAGNVSGHATLHIYPREEFGPLTSAEIGGVVLGFLLTLVVLVGAVYMVMQQYQSYCQQRAASSGSALDDHADHTLKGTPDRGQTLKEKSGKNNGVKIPSCAKPSYETVVSLTKNNGHVGVDLVNSTNNGAAPFTEVRTPPERPHNSGDNDGGSSSNNKVNQLPLGGLSMAGGTNGFLQQTFYTATTDCQKPQATTILPTRTKQNIALTTDSPSTVPSATQMVSNTVRTPCSNSSGSKDNFNVCAEAGGSSSCNDATNGSAKQAYSTFEKNNASLVNAIAFELEEKIANRVIENLNLRNRQSQMMTMGSGGTVQQQPQHQQLSPHQPRPLSEDLEDHVPPPPAPKEATSAKSSKDFLHVAALKARSNGTVSARIVHGSGGGTGSTPVVGLGGKNVACGFATGEMQLAHAQANPAFHLDLRGELRDSPDEGLGDERDYETDDGPHT